MKKHMPLAGLIVCLVLITGSIVSIHQSVQTTTPEAQRILDEFTAANGALSTGQPQSYQPAIDRATIDFAKHTCGSETPRVNWTAQERRQVEAAQKNLLTHEQAAGGAAAAAKGTYGGASAAAAYPCPKGATPPADDKPVASAKPVYVTRAVLALIDLVLALDFLSYLKRLLK